MRERLKGSERLAAGVLVCLLLAACATLTTMKFVRGGDRGIRFPHPRHAEEGLDCTDCHAIEGARAAMPNHDICGICHEIDEESADKKACEQCHTRPDQQVLPRKQRLREEVLFSHEPHVAREVDCATCHPAPDKDLLPKGAVKKFCMDCHEKYDAALNECVVCHQEIRKDKVPLWRGGARISHDVPAVWEKTHGQEYRYDQAYCTLCHDDQSFCDTCHQTTPPSDHTLAWRRKPHGLRARWDRERCAACHEEDSCWKCHRNTEPVSHRGSWGHPLNHHCANCHYPPQDTGCVTCHISIEHKKAKPSPHTFGIYPSRCGVCHPGGNPFRAPHPFNSTTTCATCH